MKLSEKIMRKYLEKKKKMLPIIFYSILVAPINANTRSRVLKEVAEEQGASVIYKDYALKKKFGNQKDITLRNVELLKPSKKKKYYTDGLNAHEVVTLIWIGYDIAGGNTKNNKEVE